MQAADFSIKGKRVFVFIPIVALLFLTAAFVIGMWSAEDIKTTVLNQFNDEQLVIARHISFLIEREVGLLERELLLFADTAPLDWLESPVFQKAVFNTFSRVAASGVSAVEIMDFKRRITRMDYPGKPPVIRPLDAAAADNRRRSGLAPGAVQISPVQVADAVITLKMATPLRNQSTQAAAFHVNVFQLLSSFLDGVRSGKTGYAWIINDAGHFLYHPMLEFVGRDAFQIRNEKDPSLSYGIINFIQKEKMMAGMSGTDSYVSGWHRGQRGFIQKLIAYYPVNLASADSLRWSVAVVAPISEIETDVQNACSKQTAMQSLIMVGIIIVGSVTIFFERRLHQLLQKEVDWHTEAFRKSEMKYRALVESAEDFIFTVDLNGRLQSLNNFTARFFGGRPSHYLGKPLEALFPPRTARRQLDLVQAVQRHGKSVKDEYDIRLNGDRFWISANYMPLKTEAENVSAVLCIARDITDRKKLEIQLVNAEKLASLGTMAAGVAHEINNPLGIMLGFTDILLRKTPPESQVWTDLKTIERQGLHCKEIIENLLCFVRIEKQPSETTDINSCIQETLNILRHWLEKSRIRLHVCLDHDPPWVKIDRRQMQQVLLNLIHNAIGAMPNGGELIVTTELDRKSDKGVVTITDNGHGIKDEDMDHIYEPFFTTKPEGKGTGLGLFVTYGIVTSYGGGIECISRTAAADREESGTTFAVRLPAAGEPI